MRIDRKGQCASSPPPYRVGELAARWGVSDETIKDALRAGRLRGFRLNRVWLIDRESAHQLERGEAAG
jgi:excisionase family DNA binding protein